MYVSWRDGRCLGWADKLRAHVAGVAWWRAGARAVSVAHVQGGARRRGREAIRERTEVSDIIGIAVFKQHDQVDPTITCYVIT